MCFVDTARIFDENYFSLVRSYQLKIAYDLGLKAVFISSFSIRIPSVL